MYVYYNSAYYDAAASAGLDSYPVIDDNNFQEQIDRALNNFGDITIFFMIEKAPPIPKTPAPAASQTHLMNSQKRNNNRPIYMNNPQGGGYQVDAPAALGNYGTMAAITGADGSAARVLSILAEAKSCVESTASVISRLGTELRSFLTATTQQQSRPALPAPVQSDGAVDTQCTCMLTLCTYYNTAQMQEMIRLMVRDAVQEVGNMNAAELAQDPQLPA